MEKGSRVKDILPNAKVTGVFAISDASLAQSRNGPFWRLLLSDATGKICAKIWAPMSLDFDHIPASCLAKVTGTASLYKDELQLSAEEFYILQPEEASELPLREFIPSSTRDPEEMFSELRAGVLKELKWKPWRKFLLSILDTQEIKESFIIIPAAKSVHHAYAGGLIEHTLGVFNLCRSFCDQYADLDRQTLLAGAILHDLGKIHEFSGGLVNDYTDAGKLIGHMLLGLELISPYLLKSALPLSIQNHLRHLILSHHGQAEFGAPCRPQTAEAFALHYADNLDAKLAQCRGLFSPQDHPGAWSDWQRTLERQIYKPPRTPDMKTVEKTEQRCLSLLKE